ncbi:MULTISPECIES: glycosyltransferase family 1 protein [unclassified Synechocystis]|uniref:glycosyltransferase family 4 protein n=1 Tax=unclassified Synechocystis TaxID=2640012 RepID=UPI0004106E62|nr:MULTISPECIES: glycosyltransferase family 1 protein [unclassified Synechocystis]AIE74697.1 glycosyl transferase group 1 [Synechocystis sp. PCC 6714]MCT0253948.1 glycosyltransferase family 4 protein [Synechocystis sp. CS-94]
MKQPPLAVALVTTCSSKTPNSMGIYTQMLMEVLSAHTDKVKLTRIDLLDLIPRLPLLSPTLERRFQQLWLTFISPWQLRSYSASADLFHLTDGSTSYVLNKLDPKKCVVTLHDLIPLLQQQGHFPIAPPGIFARWLIEQNLRSLKNQKNICVVSNCTGKDLQDNIGKTKSLKCITSTIRGEILTLLPNSIPAWKERIEQGKRLILHIGNGGFYKNQTTVVKVFAELIKNHALELIMAGGKPNRELKLIIQELELAEKIKFVPHPDDQALAKLYLSASLLLFPSHYEGFGWPPLEAMAFGCPVVCSNAGSLPEIVGNGALTTFPNDVAGLVSHCRSVLEDTNGTMELIKAGLENAKRFSPEIMAEKLLELYDSVGQHRRSPVS